MNRQAEDREFTLDKASARKFPQWDHSRISSLRYMDQEAERLKRLSMVLTMVIDTLEGIQGSVRVWQQLEEER